MSSNVVIKRASGLMAANMNQLLISVDQAEWKNDGFVFMFTLIAGSY